MPIKVGHRWSKLLTSSCSSWRHESAQCFMFSLLITTGMSPVWTSWKTWSDNKCCCQSAPFSFPDWTFLKSVVCSESDETHLSDVRLTTTVREWKFSLIRQTRLNTTLHRYGGAALWCCWPVITVDQRHLEGSERRRCYRHFLYDNIAKHNPASSSEEFAVAPPLQSLCQSERPAWRWQECWWCIYLNYFSLMYFF